MKHSKVITQYFGIKGYRKGKQVQKSELPQITRQYTTTYQSPMGKMLLAADETGLTGLWFEGGKYFANGLDPEHGEKELPVFATVKRWLDIYFEGKGAGPNVRAGCGRSGLKKEQLLVLERDDI